MSDNEDLNSNCSSAEDSDGEVDAGGGGGDSEGGGDNPELDPGGDWHPFKSRIHCQLVMIFHSSHRRNVDLVTFRAFMHVLKVKLKQQ